MKYYTILQFSKIAQTTTRTIRFYIKNQLLKSEHEKNRNITLLSEKELLTLQMINLLKSAKFTLKEIKHILENNDFKEQLKLQKNILINQIAENTAMLEMIEQLENIQNNQPQDYFKIYQHHLKSNHYKQQFMDNTPLDIRIQFHERCNKIKPEWFIWLFDHYQFNPFDQVLEVACGQGTLWYKNKERLPQHLSVTLTDLSEKMVNSCHKLLSHPQIKEITVADVRHLPYADNSFDVVIANHLLMYFDDLDSVLKEIVRVLKPNGRLFTSTISQYHNIELENLLKKFNPHASMGQEVLTHQFSLENGEQKLSPYFKAIKKYERQIPYNVDDANLLAQYIYSTRWIGNIQEILEHDFVAFKQFVQKEISLNQGIFTTTNHSGQFSAIVNK